MPQPGLCMLEQIWPQIQEYATGSSGYQRTGSEALPLSFRRCPRFAPLGCSKLLPAILSACKIDDLQYGVQQCLGRVEWYCSDRLRRLGNCWLLRSLRTSTTRLCFQEECLLCDACSVGPSVVIRLAARANITYVRDGGTYCSAPPMNDRFLWR